MASHRKLYILYFSLQKLFESVIYIITTITAVEAYTCLAKHCHYETSFAKEPSCFRVDLRGVFPENQHKDRGKQGETC
jgi:hypothetical protein